MKNSVCSRHAVPFFPLHSKARFAVATAPSLIEANAAEHSITAGIWQGGEGEGEENAGLEAGNARRCHLDEFMCSFSHVDVKLKIKH